MLKKISGAFGAQLAPNVVQTSLSFWTSRGGGGGGVRSEPKSPHGTTNGWGLMTVSRFIAVDWIQ